MEASIRFIEDITRMARKSFYIECEDCESRVLVDKFMDFLRSQKLFRNVSITDHSDDFDCPVIRCAKS